MAAPDQFKRCVVQMAFGDDKTVARNRFGEGLRL
jgi:hypothetical protein